MSPALGGTKLPGASFATFPSRWLHAIALAFCIFARLACAELDISIQEIQFKLGDNVTIAWDGGTEPVTVQLYFKGKDSEKGSALKEDIASDQKGKGSLEWATPEDLEPGTYNFAAFDEKDPVPKFSNFFDVIEGENTVFVLDIVHGIGDGVEPAETKASQTATPSETETAAPTETPNEGAVPTGSSGGLNSGAKAGIGVGVGVSGLTMLAIALLFLHRRRRRGAKRPTSPDEADEADPEDHRPNGRHNPVSTRQNTPIPPPTPAPISRATTPSKSPSSGILSHFPRSFTPKLVKAFSWGTLRSPSPSKSPVPISTPTPTSGHEKGKKVHVVGPLTELPAGDVDVEVPNRHELPTPANTPELPGISKDDGPRWL